jgi:hypothetical protein
VKPPWVNVAALAGPFGRTDGVSTASKIMPAAIRTTVRQDVAATNRDRRPTLNHTWPCARRRVNPSATVQRGSGSLMAHGS